MEWANILGVASSAASGGVLGLAGSMLGGVFKYFKRRQEISFEKAKWSHEKDLFALELQRDRQEDEHENEIMAAQLQQLRTHGSYEGLSTSINADVMIRASYKWVDAVKSLFRPFLTLCLMAMTILLFNWLMDGELDGYTEPQTIADMIVYTIKSVVFTTVTACVWWFGDRAITPKDEK